MKIKFRFAALLTFLSEKESSKTTPVSSGYRCDIKFPFDLVLHTARLQFPETDLVYPDDTVNTEMTLLKNAEITEKIYEGLDFDFYEGTQLIGHGVVTKMISQTSDEQSGD